jgi:hypothetical protein
MTTTDGNYVLLAFRNGPDLDCPNLLFFDCHFRERYHVAYDHTSRFAKSLLANLIVNLVFA